MTGSSALESHFKMPTPSFLFIDSLLVIEPVVNNKIWWNDGFVRMNIWRENVYEILWLSGLNTCIPRYMSMELYVIWKHLKSECFNCLKLSVRKRLQEPKHFGPFKTDCNTTDYVNSFMNQEEYSLLPTVNLGVWYTHHWKLKWLQEPQIKFCEKDCALMK